jgi:hypothetical protein
MSRNRNTRGRRRHTDRGSDWCLSSACPSLPLYFTSRLPMRAACRHRQWAQGTARSPSSEIDCSLALFVRWPNHGHHRDVLNLWTYSHFNRGVLNLWTYSHFNRDVLNLWTYSHFNRDVLHLRIHPRKYINGGTPPNRLPNLSIVCNFVLWLYSQHSKGVY